MNPQRTAWLYPKPARIQNPWMPATHLVSGLGPFLTDLEYIKTKGHKVMCIKDNTMLLQ